MYYSVGDREDEGRTGATENGGLYAVVPRPQHELLAGGGAASFYAVDQEGAAPEELPLELTKHAPEDQRADNGGEFWKNFFFFC